MFDEEFGTMTVIGRRFDVTRQVCGKWLAQLGLRVVGKNPTRKAQELGLVKRTTATRGNGEFDFSLWHIDKTVKLLEAAGHQQVGQPDDHDEQPSV